MASVFKTKSAEKYTILYTNQRRQCRKMIGYISKRDIGRLAMKLEERAAKIRNGDIDPGTKLS